MDVKHETLNMAWDGRPNKIRNNCRALHEVNRGWEKERMLEYWNVVGLFRERTGEDIGERG